MTGEAKRLPIRETSFNEWAVRHGWAFLSITNWPGGNTNYIMLSPTGTQLTISFDKDGNYRG